MTNDYPRQYEGDTRSTDDFGHVGHLYEMMGKPTLRARIVSYALDIWDRHAALFYWSGAVTFGVVFWLGVAWLAGVLT